jgi:hypothetical protein
MKVEVEGDFQDHAAELLLSGLSSKYHMERGGVQKESRHWFTDLVYPS